MSLRGPKTYSFKGALPPYFPLNPRRGLAPALTEALSGPLDATPILPPGKNKILATSMSVYSRCCYGGGGT